jgi:hypothetical protein
MRPSRAIVATLAVLAVAAPASAATPTIRVETVKRELTQPVTSGSVRSYVDTAGAAHVLAPRTALGQIVALAARRDVPVTVQFFASFNSGLLQRFANGQSSATGGWQFTVNGVPSQVGADTAVIPSGAEVVWWLIDDFGTQGSFLPLDLDVVSKKANGNIRFRITKFDPGTGKVAGAKGATLRVNGHDHAVSASGLVTVHVKPGTRFGARATAPSAIRSERVSGTT